VTGTTKHVLLFASKLGYQTRSFEEAARKLGVRLQYVTDRCHQLDDPWNDDAMAAHFDEPESAAGVVITAVRSRENIDAILAVGDAPAVAAAYAARGLGVPGNHPASVEACHNKLRTREVFQQAGLPVPKFRAATLNPIPEPALLGISFPCVLKPLSLSASQGVIRANNRDEFLAAGQRIRRLLESAEIRGKNAASANEILIEEYIPGREVAVEGLLIEGNLRVLAIFDKPDPLEGPYFEETIYVTPSRLPEPTQDAITQCALDATRALGLAHGPIHAEFRINEAGVWPLEVAARPIGGLCGRALCFTSPEVRESFSLEELVMRHALQLRGMGAERELAASAVMMIPVSESGIYEGAEGESDARKTAGIWDLQITARVGDYIAAWPEGSGYLGFLFARAERAEDAEAALRTAHAKLQFRFKPRLAVAHPVTGRM
jgi:predicted ATP-grasp superfamily ATP-dependent carboligase